MAELSSFSINGRPIDVFTEAQQLLNDQHMIQLSGFYEDGILARYADVLQHRSLHMYNPNIGCGSDNRIESALVRAMFTANYARLLGRDPEDFAEKDAGDIEPPLHGDSQFDQIFNSFDTELTLIKSNERGGVMANITSQDIEDPGITVVRPDTLTAIEDAVQGFHFRNHSAVKVRRLPVTLFR